MTGLVGCGTYPAATKLKALSLGLTPVVAKPQLLPGYSRLPPPFVIVPPSDVSHGGYAAATVESVSVTIVFVTVIFAVPVPATGTKVVSAPAGAVLPVFVPSAKVDERTMATPSLAPEF